MKIGRGIAIAGIWLSIPLTVGGLSGSAISNVIPLVLMIGSIVALSATFLVVIAPTGAPEETTDVPIKKDGDTTTRKCDETGAVYHEMKIGNETVRIYDRDDLQ